MQGQFSSFLLLLWTNIWQTQPKVGRIPAIMDPHCTSQPVALLASQVSCSNHAQPAIASISHLYLQSQICITLPRSHLTLLPRRPAWTRDNQVRKAYPSPPTAMHVKAISVTLRWLTTFLCSKFQFILLCPIKDQQPIPRQKLYLSPWRPAATWDKCPFCSDTQQHGQPDG